ncbi:MAG: hypothetical protein IIA44_12335, partial [Acidobacteria bacterium]|nr:hypothetical protein [Acidobacteriota bacterium]
VWVACGTFPFAHALTVDEGTILAEFATGDIGLDDTQDEDPIAIYLEGADIWGFDAETPFADYDGCEHFVDDGDNTFMGMNGEAFGALDLSEFEGVDYTQEEAAIIEFTDQMIPTGTSTGVDEDLGGDDAGTVWENDARVAGSGFYTTAVYYEALYPVEGDLIANRVITASFEFGGFEGDQDVLMGLYLDAMTPPEPPRCRSASFFPSLPGFSRTPRAGACSSGGLRGRRHSSWVSQSSPT